MGRCGCGGDLGLLHQAGIETATGKKTFTGGLRVAGSNILEIGSDTTIYRSGADALKTDDSFAAASLTAGGLVVPGLVLARKTANETVSASTTLQNDDALVAAVAANSAYQVDAYVIYDSPTAADFKCDFQGPAGATLDWTHLGTATSVAAQPASLDSSVKDINTAISLGALGAGTSTRIGLLIRGTLVTSGTAGSLQFRWAQAASDAGTTTVRAQSWLRLTKVT